MSVMNFCSMMRLMHKQILVHADDFPDQHLALYIGVEAVIGPFRSQDGLAGIVEVGLQGDVIGLLADKSFSSMNVLAPFDIKIAPPGKRGNVGK